MGTMPGEEAGKGIGRRGDSIVYCIGARRKEQSRIGLLLIFTTYYLLPTTTTSTTGKKACRARVVTRILVFAQTPGSLVWEPGPTVSFDDGSLQKLHGISEKVIRPSRQKSILRSFEVTSGYQTPNINSYTVFRFQALLLLTSQCQSVQQ